MGGLGERRAADLTAFGLTDLLPIVVVDHAHISNANKSNFDH
jgi:hypothetical protein